jgi:hypothetical protein
MAEGKCEICGGPPIGVACTIMPYSVAYCAECCRRFAQPRIVFECLWEDVGVNFDRLQDGLPELETFHDGRYVTYKEWARERRNETDEDGSTGAPEDAG